MAASEWTSSIPAVGNQISSDIPYIEKNFEELKEILDDVTDGTVGTTDTASFAITSLGKRNIWIGSNDMWGRTTSGPAASQGEFSTNKLNRKILAFDSSVEEYAQTLLVMPEGWDRGTIKAKIYWGPASGASQGDTVEWEISGLAMGDDDDMASASYGTSQVISDTVLAGTNGDLHITSATPAVTIGGTPALGDIVSLQISRNVSGTDDMTEDAYLYGVMLQITIDQSITAW